ncbi:MAG: hypothetical protein Q4A60_04760 [Pasteurellaceae bacterium]|nr:hypothetical protein [Pasteurellaceae bacterium]
MSKNIPRPSTTEVKKYLKQWETLENYTSQEEALNKLFGQLMPKNEQLGDILLKASTLNDFYSTNIFSVYSVAKHIHSLNIDEALQKGDVSLVDKIKEVEISGKKKRFYSFATKYCSHHNPQAFPIYDRFVDNLLWRFKQEYQFSSFKRDDLKNYEKFKQVLVDFQHFFGLEQFDLRQIDRYLWLQGKAFFKKT